MDKFTQGLPSSLTGFRFLLLKVAFLLSGLLLFVSATAQAQKTYYWRGQTTASAGNDWSDGANWSENTTGPNTGRTAAPTDILVFDGAIGAVFPANSAPIIVNFKDGGTDPIEQVIGQLRIINGASVVLSGPSTTNANSGSVLTIGSTTAASTGTDDFFVDAASSLAVVQESNANNRFLNIGISTGKKGLVRGSITVGASASQSAISSRLLAADAGGLVFSGSAQFSAVAVSGSPFGTTGSNTLGAGFTDVTTPRSVVFQTGTTFTQQGGENPFGLGTRPVAVFESGSFYIYAAGTGVFSNVGQTYGNLEFRGDATVGDSPLNQMIIQNNLTVTSGVVNLNEGGYATGAATSLKGDLILNGGTLNFGPATAGTVAFTGTAPQTIRGTGALNFGTIANPNALFEINNAAGVTLARPVTVNGGLVLTSGLIKTDATNLLTLPSTATISGGSSSSSNGVGGSFVNGPVARRTAVTNAANPVPLAFPVGKVNPAGAENYRPMFLNIMTQSTSVTYIGEQMETPPAQSLTKPLTRVSHVRYFTLVPSAPITAPYNATLTLSFDVDDYANFPNDPNFVIARRDVALAPSNWVSAGRFSNGGTATNGAFVAGTLTSGELTSFAATDSNFSLASTNADGGVNPLPVELTRFSATAEANSVGVSWATASEKNNDRFEVQRSTTGQAFGTLGTVKGQGSTTSAHAYSYVDSRPLAGVAYYRLRQVDADGTATFSPVVTAKSANASDFAVFPNPSAGTVTLPAALGTVHYRVLNVLGQAVLSGQAAGNDRIDLTRLTKGTFFLELTAEAGRTTQRLVRE